MAFDYSGLFSTATDLIAQFGRDVSLVLPPQTPADSSKPFGARQTPAVATDDITLTGIKAVFLSPEESDRTGQILEALGGGQNVQETQARVLVAASSLGTNRLDLRWRVVDGDRRLEIVRVEPVQPGGTLLYYDLLVNL